MTPAIASATSSTGCVLGSARESGPPPSAAPPIALERRVRHVLERGRAGFKPRALLADDRCGPPSRFLPARRVSRALPSPERALASPAVRSDGHGDALEGPLAGMGP